jgi:signal peptidase II
MPRKNLLALGLSAAVVTLDQATKSWILRTVAVTHKPVEILPGCFHLIYVENLSAAFGLLSFLPFDARRYVLSGLALVAFCVLVFLLVSGRIQRGWTATAAGLIAGGALGNAIDRLRLGHVVDFIDWHIADHFHWNTFNVADSGIVVGVFLLLWISYRTDRQIAANPTGERVLSGG